MAKERVETSLHPDLIKKIDELIADYYYENRAEVIRAFFNEMFDIFYENKKSGGAGVGKPREV